MQIFLLQAASQLDRAGCLFLAVLHRTISLPSTVLLSGWLLAGSELPDEGILHRAIEPLDRPSSLAAGQLGACFWIADVCIFSPTRARVQLYSCTAVGR
jgi:hypothetical protein